MNSENKLWEKLKADYLSQIKEVLSSLDSPRKKEILEDVKNHLDRRFNELGSNPQTMENLQRIISDMGPASDYAELLGENSVKPYGIWRHFVVNACFSLTILATLILVSQILDYVSRPYFGIRVAPQQYEVAVEPVFTFMTLQGRYVDLANKIPFVNDPNIIGQWKSVDFVHNLNDFVPGQKKWQWDLWYKGQTFFEGGRTNNEFKWTKGLLININPFSQTVSHYLIKPINGIPYLFLEWKSGDYTILHRKPSWYVMVKDDSESITKKSNTANSPESSL